MADLTAARRLESEFALLGCRIVTGSAGEFVVAIVVEAVNGDWWRERRRTCYLRRRIALPARLSTGRVRTDRLLQCFRSIERDRRIGLAARAGDAPPNPFMAATAIAGVYPRRMGLMAQDTVLGHPPMGRSGVKCNITRVRMALRVGTGPHRVSRFDLRVWIMTHPAGPAMRIAIERELGELRRHLVTRQALLEVGA
jgi:hypothetical protein